MANNEGWDSVFLQALQNSLAQSKAENKWNQELALRDRQFGLDTQKFEADKEYNNKLLAGQQEDRKINWLNNYTPVTTDFGVIPTYAEGETPLKDPVAIYNKFLASRYGPAVDNPSTPEVDWYIPKTSFTALTADRTAAENKLAQIKTSFTDEKTASDSFNKFVEPVKDMAPLAKVNNIGDFFTATDKLWQNAPTGAYYDNTALRALGDKDINWKSTQRDIDAANYRAKLDYDAQMYRIGLEEKARRDAKLGAYKAINKEGKEERFTNVTPEDLRAQGYTLFQRIPEEEVYNSERYDRSSRNAPSGNKPIKQMNPQELSAFVQGLKDSGIDISYIPSVQNAVLNRTDELARQGYISAGDKENIWGGFVDILSIPYFGLAPNFYPNTDKMEVWMNPQGEANRDYQTFKTNIGGNDSFDQWIQTSQDPNVQALWNARKLAKRTNGTGQDPHTTLGGSPW